MLQNHSCTTDTENLIRRVRGMNSYTLTSLSLPQAGTVLPQEGPSGPTPSPVGKWEPKVDIQFHQCCRTLSRKPTQVSFHRDHGRSLQSFNTGNQIETEKGAGLTEVSTQILTDCISECSATWIEIPTSNSACLWALNHTGCGAHLTPLSG